MPNKTEILEPLEQLFIQAQQLVSVCFSIMSTKQRRAATERICELWEG